MCQLLFQILKYDKRLLRYLFFFCFHIFGKLILSYSKYTENLPLVQVYKSNKITLNKSKYILNESKTN